MSSSIIRFLETYLETYERVSNISREIRNERNVRVEPSTSTSSFVGDIIVSAMFSYFHPGTGEEKKEDNKDSFPLPFVSISKISSSEKECPICFDEYKEEQLKNKQIVITECGHLFHKDCVVNWLDEKKNCPVCRYEFN